MNSDDLYNRAKANFIKPIADDDEMFNDKSESHYVSVGLSALRSILGALSAGDRGEPSSILDMPCGHGRVMRMLKAAFPSASLVACDINRSGVEYCASTFQARPVISIPDPEALDLGQKFDLIWSGSLLTHLDSFQWVSFLNLWAKHLNEGGVIVFTTHGRRSLKLMTEGFSYGLLPRPLKYLLRDYYQDGFGYQNYPAVDAYGISLSDPSWILKLVQARRDLTVCYFGEALWDGHQDIFGLQLASVLPRKPLKNRQSVDEKNATLAVSPPPPPELEWTGERLIPSLGGQIAAEHLHRYALAQVLVDQKDVLDIACGEGYGALLLAQKARSVTGVDVDEECIRHATRKYPRDNLKFLTGSCVSIPMADASIDVVSSFETIEHIAEQDQFLREIRRVLRPGGIVIISTPERANYDKTRDTLNPFHMKELSFDEFRAFMRERFVNASFLTQRYSPSSVLIDEDGIKTSDWGVFQGGYNGFEFSKTIPNPTYMLALCGDGPLPSIPSGLFEFQDPEPPSLENPSNACVQLFADSGHGFDASRSTAQYLPVNTFQTVRFDGLFELCGEGEVRLRIDPSDRAAVVTLRRIRIVSSRDGDFIARSEIPPSALTHLPPPNAPAFDFSEIAGFEGIEFISCMAFGQDPDGLRVFCPSDDPQLLLPAIKILSAYEYTLEVTLKVDCTPAEISLGIRKVSADVNEMLGNGRELQRQTAELEYLRQTVSDQATELQTTSTSLREALLVNGMLRSNLHTLEHAHKLSQDTLQKAVDSLIDSITADINRLRGWESSTSWKLAAFVPRIVATSLKRKNEQWGPSRLANVFAEELRQAYARHAGGQIPIEKLTSLRRTLRTALTSFENSLSMQIMAPLRGLERIIAGADGKKKAVISAPAIIESLPPVDTAAEKPGHNRSFAIYYSSQGNYFFREISILLLAGFRKLGFPVELRTEEDGWSDSAGFHLVVAPHEYFLLGRGPGELGQVSRDQMLLFNTEQEQTPWFERALTTFLHARHIFDIHLGATEAIQRLGFSASHLPLGYLDDFPLYDSISPLPHVKESESLSAEVCNWMDTDLPLSERPIDVSFVGEANLRRAQFFSKAAACLQKFECHLRLMPQIGPRTAASEDRDLRTRLTAGISRRSKIVLNVHRDEAPYFEWHRIVLMGIWQKALVITETVTDTPPFVAGVDFVHAPINDIPGLLDYYLRDPAGIREAEKIRSAGFAKLRDLCSLPSALEKALQPIFHDVIQS